MGKALPLSILPSKKIVSQYNSVLHCSCTIFKIYRHFFIVEIHDLLNDENEDGPVFQSLIQMYKVL